MVNNWGKRTSLAVPEISLGARDRVKKLEKLRRGVTATAKKRDSGYL